MGDYRLSPPQKKNKWAGVPLRVRYKMLNDEDVLDRERFWPNDICGQCGKTDTTSIKIKRCIRCKKRFCYSCQPYSMTLPWLKTCGCGKYPLISSYICVFYPNFTKIRKEK
jgi:hypothetical protein